MALKPFFLDFEQKKPVCHKKNPQSNLWGLKNLLKAHLPSREGDHHRIRPAGYCCSGLTGKAGSTGADFSYFIPKARVSKALGLKARVSSTSSGVKMRTMPN